MSLTIRNVAREFTPAEVATITGVPVAQQRDWRRREIIAGKEGTGWTRFDVNDVIDLAVLRFFTRMGFAPSALSAIRHMAVLPTIAGIYENEGGYEFTGDEIDAALRQRVVGSSVGGVSSHILVITGDDMGNPSVVRVSNYNAVGEALARAATPNGVILDCFKLADHLIAKAGGPLFRIEAEAE